MEKSQFIGRYDDNKLHFSKNLYYSTVRLGGMWKDKLEPRDIVTVMMDEKEIGKGIGKKS